MRPIFYVNNLLASGTLSGFRDGTYNPKERLADGAVTLPYTTTSGVTPSGTFGVSVSGATQPDTLVVVRATNLENTTWQVESEDVGGANTTVVASGDVVGSPDFFVLDITQGTDRQVWRVIATGVNGASQVKTYEALLADKVQLPRSPLVGVSRERVRQFTRLDVPGSQAFVKRDGPRLRRTTYTFVTVSGAQTDLVRNLIDNLEGGEGFWHQDDISQSYYAELLGADVREADEAGVSTWTLTVQEIATD